MKNKEVNLATFGLGCFWGPEDTFRKMKGVVDTAVGYMGGTVINPTYEDVCSGTTGHVEVVQIKYDPDLISYNDLLTTFWSIHDPTQINRQGPDIGRQYRSVIFYHSPEQKTQAEHTKQILEKGGKFDQSIATTIEPVQEFYRAEDYHQQYIKKTGRKVC